MEGGMSTLCALPFGTMSASGRWWPSSHKFGLQEESAQRDDSGSDEAGERFKLFRDNSHPVPPRQCAHSLPPFAQGRTSAALSDLSGTTGGQRFAVVGKYLDANPE